MAHLNSKARAIEEEKAPLNKDVAENKAVFEL